MSCQWPGWGEGHLTYHAGAPANNQRLLVCFVVVIEGGMECRLRMSVSKCSGYIAGTDRTNRQNKTDDTQT